MTEQANVHEEVQTDNDALGGENIGVTVDRSPDSAGADESGPARGAVAEARRYRKRAQAAEKELEELKKNLAASEKTLQEQQQALESLQKQQEIDRLLHEAGAIDRDAAHALIDSALGQMSEPDVSAAVEELRRSKPYLFRQGMRRGKPGSGVMGAREVSAEPQRAIAIDDAAETALQTGKRIDLLRYLRLRRKK